MSRESIGKQIGTITSDLISSFSEGILQYKEETEDRRQNLHLKQTVFQEKTKQKVQKLKQKAEHKFKTKEHEFKVEMEKKERKAKVEVENYQRFLDSFEELRERLEEFYPNMPPAMILIIHEHATQLLHEMREAPNAKGKIAGQKKLIQFLSLVSEDTSPAALQGDTNTLPYRTLGHIQGKN